MPTSRVLLTALVLTLGSAAGRAQTAPASGEMLAPLTTDPAIAKAISAISPQKIHDDIAALVSYGTRNTLSSMATDLPKGQGILAAADWIEAEFNRISKDCGGCLEVKRDDYTEQPGAGPQGRVKAATRLVNVYAVLHGTDAKAPWVLVTGHYDSRATDVMDPRATSPGANDDASGVAVSIESARVLSKMKLRGTIVFVAVAGEEQGLLGARHLAQLARKENWPLEAVLNNDIVGGDTTPGETMQDKSAVRVFSENVPGNATDAQIKQMLSLGAENDSPSRELARTIAEIAPAYFQPGTARPAQKGPVHSHLVMQVPAFHPVLELRRDRYLRGGDHTSFNAEGFAAVRFTEWRENFDHQHQTVRTENGKQYGDLIEYVDMDYVAHVAELNSAVLATLAQAPGEPLNVRIKTTALDNNSELTWEAPADAAPGTMYQVLWRPTDTMQWRNSFTTKDTHVLLNVSKDNVLFAVRSVAADGHTGLPVPPVPAGR